MTNVFFTGADNVNWATADDWKLFKASFPVSVKFTSLKECQVIHSVNWQQIVNLPYSLLTRKYVICHIPHDVRNMLTQPSYLKIAPFVDLWVVMSRMNYKLAREIGLNCLYIPNPVDLNVFYPINDKESLIELKKQLNIPLDTYLIGSFQRDTEGKDLVSPKLVKGPDIFLEIVRKLNSKKAKFCVILAGPRRFWLKSALKELRIPFVFIGDLVPKNKDDIKENTLHQDVINRLYNLVDLYIVSSRLEGGPKAILECAASKTKIISTRVGQAPDILASSCIYENIDSAIKVIQHDISNNFLSKSVNIQYKNSLKHAPTKLTNYWADVYQNKNNLQPKQDKLLIVPEQTLLKKLKRRLSPLKMEPRFLTISDNEDIQKESNQMVIDVMIGSSYDELLSRYRKENTKPRFLLISQKKIKKVQDLTL